MGNVREGFNTAVPSLSCHTELGGASVCSQFEVKDVVWDERLGAEKLDLLLLDHFADEFQAKHGTDVRQYPKAVAKLKRQVQHPQNFICGGGVS